MCQFFSFNTEPEFHGGQRFYFDWDMRKANLKVEADSHSIIAKHFDLNEDKCNKYEYNPLTGLFRVDQINSEVDDSIQAEEWVRKLDFKKVVEPLIIKPIVHPFKLPKVKKVTDEQIEWLKQWASVGASVCDSVWDSVGAYTSSFFDKKYDHDFTPCVNLWEAGLVPSFDGTTWRLLSGKKVDEVYEWKPAEEAK
jgi:hypothetical protein